MTTSPAGETIRYDNGQWHVPAQPRIGCISGDGIGPEIMQAARRVWDVAIARSYGDARRIHWVELPLGEDAFAQYSTYYPDSTRDALRELRIAIKGPFTTPVGGGFRSLNVSLRQTLDLYACVRPVRYYPGVPSPMLRPEEVDVVIYRENTEDVYAGIEYAAGSEENRKLADFLRRELGAHFFEGAGLGIKPISEYGSKRLVRMAIEHAITHKRKSVTLVHKGNIMKYTEGAFRTWGYEVARDEYPAQTISEKEVDEKHGGVVPDGKIVIKDRIADAMFQQMLLRPAEYDVTAPAASPAGTQSAGTPGGDGPTGPARPLPWPTPAEAPLDQQATVARYQPVLTDAMVAADHEFGPMTWQSRTAFRRSLNGSCTLSLTARGYDNPSLHGQRTATWVERSNQVMARHGFEPVVPWSSAGGESVLASTQRGENVAYSVYWLSGMLILVEVGAAPQQCP